MHPRYYVPTQDRYPMFVGLCRCGCLFPVVDAEGVTRPGEGIVPLARCPQCNGWVGMSERKRPEGGPCKTG